MRHLIILWIVYKSSCLPSYAYKRPIELEITLHMLWLILQNPRVIATWDLLVFPAGCRSNPSTLRIEEGLKKIKAWEASPTPNGERICDALSGLEELYACIDELLKLNLTQQALSLHQHEEWIDGVLDGSLRLIDGCGIIREVISQIREHVRDLQSALRRR